MADGVTIKVEGADRLAATMRRAGHELSDWRTANERVAAAVAQQARGRAPRRTGALARSTTGHAAPGNVARLEATVIYAGVIHNGWPRHNISPQPYLRDTLTATQGQWMGIYTAEAEKVLSRVQGA